MQAAQPFHQARATAGEVVGEEPACAAPVAVAQRPRAVSGGFLAVFGERRSQGSQSRPRITVVTGGVGDTMHMEKIRCQRS